LSERDRGRWFVWRLIEGRRFRRAYPFLRAESGSGADGGDLMVGRRSLIVRPSSTHPNRRSAQTFLSVEGSRRRRQSAYVIRVDSRGVIWVTQARMRYPTVLPRCEECVTVPFVSFFPALVFVLTIVSTSLPAVSGLRNTQSSHPVPPPPDDLLPSFDHPAPSLMSLSYPYPTSALPPVRTRTHLYCLRLASPPRRCVYIHLHKRRLSLPPPRTLANNCPPPPPFHHHGPTAAYGTDARPSIVPPYQCAYNGPGHVPLNLPPRRHHLRYRAPSFRHLRAHTGEWFRVATALRSTRGP
jgi:hypothetical protein